MCGRLVAAPRGAASDILSALRSTLVLGTMPLSCAERRGRLAMVTTLKVRVVDSHGIEHTADFPSAMRDDACVVCHQLHAGMNLLALSGTFFCDSCWYQMGMRPVGGGAYAHTQPDALFVDARANIPGCPTYDADFGACTPFEIRRAVRARPTLKRALDECLGEHGRTVTREDLQDECTAILGSISARQFDCLVQQGRL